MGPVRLLPSRDFAGEIVMTEIKSDSTRQIANTIGNGLIKAVAPQPQLLQTLHTSEYVQRDVACELVNAHVKNQQTCPPAFPNWGYRPVEIIGPQ